jgi:hypothetical protein
MNLLSTNNTQLRHPLRWALHAVQILILICITNQHVCLSFLKGAFNWSKGTEQYNCSVILRLYKTDDKSIFWENCVDSIPSILQQVESLAVWCRADLVRSGYQCGVEQNQYEQNRRKQKDGGANRSEQHTSMDRQMAGTLGVTKP